MRVVNFSNSLSKDIVQAPLLNAFKNRFDKFYDKLGVQYSEGSIIDRRRKKVKRLFYKPEAYNTIK